VVVTVEPFELVGGGAPLGRGAQRGFERVVDTHQPVLRGGPGRACPATLRPRRRRFGRLLVWVGWLHRLCFLVVVVTLGKAVRQEVVRGTF
jgi:hypothetical protein